MIRGTLEPCQFPLKSNVLDSLMGAGVEDMGSNRLRTGEDIMIRRLGHGALVVMVFLVGIGWLGAGHAATPTGSLLLITEEAPQPKAARVATGAVVIWLNRTADRPLSLTFEGTSLPDPACPAGFGFVRRGGQVFTLPALPPGGTASLCFPAPGIYGYAVHGLDRPASGTVTVGAHR